MANEAAIPPKQEPGEANPAPDVPPSGDGSGSTTSGKLTRRQRRQRNRDKQTAATPTAQVKQEHKITIKFEGELEGYKDCIFDMTTGTGAALYNKTLERLGGYCSSKYGHEVRESVLSQQPIKFDLPTHPSSSDVAEMALFNEEIKQVAKEKRIATKGLKDLFGTIWGQCTPTLRTELKSVKGYHEMKQAGDTLELLRKIRAAVTSFNEEEKLSVSIHVAIRKLYTLYQGNMTNEEYLKEFEFQVEVIREANGEVGLHPALTDNISSSLVALPEYEVGMTAGRKTAIDAERAVAKKENQKIRTDANAAARERYFAVAFILGACRKRYLLLLDNLHNDYQDGTDNYPKTLPSAFQKLQRWRQAGLEKMIGSSAGGVPQHGQVAFMQQGGQNSGPDTRRCHHCNVVGHIRPDCPKLKAGLPPAPRPPAAASNSEPPHSNSAVTATTVGTPATDHKAGVGMFHFGGDDFDPADYNWGGSAVQFMCIGDPDRTHSFSHSGPMFSSASTDRLTTDMVQIRRSDGTTSHEKSTAFNQQHAGISPMWVLLDNQSTVDLFCNPKLLRNIRRAQGFMDVHCNAGMTTTNLIGDLPGYGTVWFHPNGIANILSLSRVANKPNFRITYDSNDGNEFRVYRPDGSVRRFRQTTSGLFVMDLSDDAVGTVLVNSGSTRSRYETVMVSTVAENSSRYTNRDFARAKSARRLQAMIGRPHTRDFVYYIENPHILPGATVTKDDILAAEDIFGPDLGSLKGKTTRRKAKHVTIGYGNVPRVLLERYRRIVLCIDIMYVNKIAFFVTISRNIKFITCECIKNRKQATMYTAVGHACEIYNRRGFRVMWILGDGEFECIRGDCAGEPLNLELNIAANDEHVPEIERAIRTIKERVRCIYNMLPFEKIPKAMVVEMIMFTIMWLNNFPARDGIAPTLGPRAIITGQTLTATEHCQIEFGQYVQTHEPHDNSMVTRTVGALALRPTGNAQGSYYFFSLASGRILNRKEWTELPMPAEAADAVLRFAKRSQSGITFTDSNGVEYETDEDVSEYSSDGSDEDSDESDDESSLDDDSSLGDEAAMRGLDLNREATGISPQTVRRRNAGVRGNASSNRKSQTRQPTERLPTHQQTAPEAAAEDASSTDNDADTEDSDADESDGEDDESQPDTASDDEPPGPAALDELGAFINEANQELEDILAGNSPNYQEVDEGNIIHGKRRRRTRDEDWRYQYQADTSNRRSATSTNLLVYADNIEPSRPHQFGDLHAALAAIIMTQYNVKQGLKVFKEKGEAAVLKELRQLHDRQCLEPKMAHELSLEEKKAALKYLMFLKEKRDGTIKGRGCADGRKQRAYMTKEETASPTVSTEALMLSCLIDALEERVVATCDVPGAFMQTEMEGEDIHMVLTGEMADIITKLDPEAYTKYTKRDRKGNSILYVRLKKVLYGTLQAALLFWQNLSRQLQEWGFAINPYDWCVANKMVDDNQCTIIWHVDDLKISHVKEDVVEDVLKMLDAKYGQEVVDGERAELTITRGKVHDYLGMEIDYREKGVVKINMIEYITKMLDDIPKDMIGTTATPAASHLFQSSENPDLLNEETGELFHHLVAKLLFLTRHGRPDIQTAIAYLCTRVKSPDKDDYKKLTRVMRYLQGSLDLVLTLRADNMNVVKWWVDGSFAVHGDDRGHTGAMMSMGQGAAYSSSKKQKINTKSSTEAELVGVDDIMPQLLWTQYFLESQGYTTDTILNQDNMSSIQLENHGKASSSQRTRHIHIRYFFVTDRVAKNELAIQYCPTGEMTGDYFTKPLQGALFQKFRDQIMGVVSMPVPDRDHRSVLLLRDRKKRFGYGEAASDIHVGTLSKRSWSQITQNND